MCLANIKCLPKEVENGPLICFSAVAEGIQDNVSFDDVISEAVVADADTPLPLPRGHAGEFPDVMLSIPVVRVDSEHGPHFFEHGHEFGSPLRAPAHVPLETRRGDDSERL